MNSQKTEKRIESTRSTVTRAVSGLIERILIFLYGLRGLDGSLLPPDFRRDPSLLYIHNLDLVRTVCTEAYYRMPFVKLHPTERI